MYKNESIFKNTYKYDAQKRAQHMAVRTTAGWYLYTHHMVEVKGEDAAAFLDWICMNPIANLKLGSARYTQLLNEEGIIIDDAVVFKMEENLYWVSTLYAHFLIKWFETHRGQRKVEFKKITEEWDMYSVQGPKSAELINRFLAEPVDEVKFFTIRDNKIGDIPVKIARSGFTGEKLGYEIYVAPKDRKVVEDALSANSEAVGALQVTDTQIMIWTLPTEKGFYLMVDMRGTNPFEVGFDRIKWEREFLGKEALQKIQAEGPKRKLMGFTVADERAHIACRNLSGPGCAVMLDGDEIGRVTKFTYSFVRDIPIGYALIDIDKAVVGQKVLMNDYEAVLCDKVFC